MGLYEEYLSHNATSPKIEVDYIDLDPDVLVHFKYIRKEFKNGKWRYYYNRASKVKEFIDTKITGKAYDQHFQELEETNLYIDAENKKLLKEADNISKKTYILPSDAKKAQNQLNKIESTLSRNTAKINRNKNEQKTLIKKYYGRSLKGITSTAISKVKDVLSTLAYTIL